ncbi:hypothetical protein [Labrenzia sp. DG1229]|uniref:hypothetical protein n=1 Tax=Labrenzia sp. DG1229 TaxID=681847 RepID=UPI00048AE08E|nr:hypothetical protein [Labrenzia sp. DG1229]
MARFPYFQRNVAALGRLLAHARLDPAKFEKLKSNPQMALAELGLPGQVTSLMEFAVIDGEYNNSIALPYRLNQERLREYNKEYLLSLATTFSQNPSETGTISEEKPLH